MELVIAGHLLNELASATVSCRIFKHDEIANQVEEAALFEDAFDAISESGSPELEYEYRNLVQRFITSRNLRYTMVEPFKLYSHMPGIFAALFADIEAQANQSDQLRQALADFKHAFRALEELHSEADMKTCILKATMLAEALARMAEGMEKRKKAP